MLLVRITTAPVWWGVVAVDMSCESIWSPIFAYARKKNRENINRKKILSTDFVFSYI